MTYLRIHRLFIDFSSTLGRLAFMMVSVSRSPQVSNATIAQAAPQVHYHS
ncbi:hypothetical protein [Tychonema sp. BBK16]